jgi:hypothetical protein
MASTVFPAAGGGVTQKVQEFTATGTFTAPSNCSAVRLFLVAGGGGGGSARYTGGTSGAGGGGGGGVVVEWQLVPVTPGASYTVTIGAGGAGSSSDAAGSVGVDTTFGALLTAQGGGGGGTFSSAGGYISPSVKGTSGGYMHVGNGVAVGGAGAAALMQLNYGTSADSGSAPAAGNAFTSITNPMNGAPLSPGNNATSHASGGVGIKGFGGGGNGGTLLGVVNSYTYVSIHGGGTTATDAAGGNGSTNKGGGGGGGSNNANTARNGGSGGSGYALVEYWS